MRLCASHHVIITRYSSIKLLKQIGNGNNSLPSVRRCALSCRTCTSHGTQLNA